MRLYVILIYCIIYVYYIIYYYISSNNCYIMSIDTVINLCEMAVGC